MKRLPEETEPYYTPAQPPEGDWYDVCSASKACQACHLWRYGTQTVFGAGSLTARMMLVGEQPGDKEDLEGKPFVGPAGKILWESLAEAGIEAEEVYVTNAVKHFKWEAKGARRIHKKPNRAEMAACRPWLEEELRQVQPDLLVCLGATAAQSVLGSKFKLLENRGKVLESDSLSDASELLRGIKVLATVHPSSILRVPERDRRHVERAAFVRDLRSAKAALSERRAYMH